jgi:hypothetical protein
MENGMIKMIIKVTVIAIILLTVSLFLVARYGGLMMKSISTSQQTNQNNETGTSDSSNTINQNKK